MTSIEEVTIGAFSQPLVGMSFIISVLGSWVGLTCANRARRRKGSTSWLWLFGAAASIGGGAIWSMHFIGMLAFDSHVAYALDIGTTLISLGVAIVAAMVGMLIATALRGNAGYIVGGLVTGAGVCAMHYTGMYAMDMSAEMVWKPMVVVASVIIALVASALALFFAFNVTTRLMRTGAAIIMGIGVCVMHYTGMMALEIHSSDDDKLGHVNGADPVYLAMPIFAISAGMLIVIAFGTMFAGIDDDLNAPEVAPTRSVPDDAAPRHGFGAQGAFGGGAGDFGGASAFRTSRPQPAADMPASRMASGPQPMQALPQRQPPAAGGVPQHDPFAPAGTSAPPARPGQLRPQQSGRWSPRPYTQQASNSNSFPARRTDRFQAQNGTGIPEADEQSQDFFGGRSSEEQPAQEPRQPGERKQGWLPPRTQR
ncbi:MAG: MHYT domain-containing protein [Nocardioides sp.]|uniref:MHYT domain-containing protein n=1 Tax=Nocardioides sp. TaxID=35761 RepID=UPI003D6C228F